MGNTSIKLPVCRYVCVTGLTASTLMVMLILAGCANQRPVLATAEPDAGKQAIHMCIQRAQAHGLSYDDGGQLTRRTAISGAIGAAGGAAAGAIYGDAARGAAAGAAGGVVAGLMRGLLTPDGPAPVYRRYVNHCLRQKGYEPVGWG